MRRYRNIEDKLKNYINKTDTCWLWTRDFYNYGYGRLSLENGKQVRVHRYMYEKYKGEIPSGMNVLHTCDVPACCNPDHLFLGTQKDNVKDMMDKGRGGYKTKIGTDSPNSKISDDDVREIRRLYASGELNQREIGEKFNMAQVSISRIILGYSYKEVV